MDQAGENCKYENSCNNDTDDSHDNLATTGIVLTMLFANSVPLASFLCNDAHHIPAALAAFDFFSSQTRSEHHHRHLTARRRQ
jgi:hypothetical protein